MKEKGEKGKEVADPRAGDEEGKKVGGGKSEEKAAKIQRLKSGFRLCKPQGTFLWPSSMAMPPQIVVQAEDLLALPTPPSVSSSTSPQPPPPLPSQPISPVKPLAEKRHVNLTPHHNTTLINLNELPSVTASTNNVSHGTFASASAPYQPNHTLTTITDVLPRVINGKDVVNPWEALAGPESKNWIGYSHQWQQRRGYSNSNSTPTSTSTSTSNTCLGMGLGTWLALSSPNSMNNSHRN